MDQLAALRDDTELADLCRYAENLLSEAQVRKRHRLGNDVWDALGSDDLLIERVEAETARRIRDGSSKRERARMHVIRAPDVAASIMDDVSANSRHRLDACRVLDDFSGNGPEAMPSDRFIINICMGSDSDGKPIIQHFDKAIKPDAPLPIAADVQPAPIAATPKRKRRPRKSKDDGRDEHI
jgi:hypothetical protein